MKYYYFLPVNIESKIFPIFLSIPAFEVGMPVCRAIRCLICVIPSARFSEKLRPGMGVDLLLLMILHVYLLCKSLLRK